MEPKGIATKTELPAISSILTSYSCQTKSVVNEIDFKWTVERLAFLGHFRIWEPALRSVEFSDDKFKLEIATYINNDEYLQINLIHTNLRYPIGVEIAVGNKKREKIFDQKTKVDISPGIASTNLLIMRKQVLLESADYVNGKTTVHCKIKSLTRKLLAGKATAATATKRREIPMTETRDSDRDLIPSQLDELFEKMVLSDVTFNIRGRKFAAHKAILAMRSPVFAAMFQHPTKEVQTGEVEVEDVDPDVFQEVLHYLYTGLTRSAAMEVMAPGLLAAAEKYLLDHLKAQCETHLIRQMSAKNCLDLLTLTTHHPAEHLKKFAIEYFRRYPSEVMETELWKTMKKENPAVLCDLQQMVFTAPTV